MPRILIPLAQGCEELEAVTLIDLLRRAGMTVISAGLDAMPVRASRGVVLLPDTTLDEVLDQEFDMIVLPGGLPGADYLNQDARIQTLLKTTVAAGRYVAAICAAPKVLASAGLLAGKRATSYPGVLNTVSGLHFIDAPVVIDGQVLTSRGPGTAMDFALAIIETLLGIAQREAVEAQLVRG